MFPVIAGLPVIAISVQLPLAAMLATAFGLRRSLGAWPVYASALLVAVPITLASALTDIEESRLVALLLGLCCTAMPSTLFLLARVQCIPGLRRGVMSLDERKRWLSQHAFREMPTTERRLLHVQMNDRGRRLRGG